LDFEGAEGEVLAMMADFGVVGVDCAAMVKDLRIAQKLCSWRGREVSGGGRGQGLSIITTFLSSILSGFSKGDHIGSIQT
jgi:hypothetical protein